MKCLSFLMYIKGDMSIVGPRPQLVDYETLYTKADASP